MFDKLIESDTAGADFKNRSRYFTVSTIIVGILFLTAVVYSLYAAEVGLGAVNLDIAELVAPLEATEPERPREQEQNNKQQSRSELPIRTANIARPDEFLYVPDKPSGVPSTIPSRPIGKYLLDPGGIDSGWSAGPSGAPFGGSSDRRAGTSTAPNVLEDNDKPTGPPPPPVTKPATRSLGVINGKATYLPIPAYPQPARAVGASGEVKVQVSIDEDGKVISAKAASGHPLLRPAAETSARNAKFSPTYLSKVPVKVTGVIIYNFKKN